MSSGGSANSASARTNEKVLAPNGSGSITKSTSSAKVGTARAALPALTASTPPRPMWPSQTASGTATTVGGEQRQREMPRCSTRRFSRPAVPRPARRVGQVAEQVAQRSVHARAPLVHGVKSLCRASSSRSASDRQHHAEHDGGEHLRPGSCCPGPRDQVAEAAEAHEEADRGQRDGRDRGHPQPGEDRGQRERHLHPPQHPARAKPIPRAASTHVVGDGVEPGHHVAHQDGERVQPERRRPPWCGSAR